MSKIRCRQRTILCQRIRCLGIERRLTYALVDTMFNWVKHSGPEWTVKRIKSLKVDYIRFLTGQNPIGKWYKKHRDGRPKGPFGALWKLETGKALAVLNLYSILISQEPTLSQWKKFSEAVRMTENPQDVRDIYEKPVTDLLVKLLDKKKPKKVHMDVDPIDDFVVSPSKRAATGLNFRSIPEDNWFIGIRAFQTDYYKTNFLPLKCIQDALGPNWINRLPLNDEDFDYRWGCQAFVGNIGLIQEPGMKARFVANPHRIIQHALQPLGDLLFEALGNVFPDCTYDQYLGCQYIQRQLQRGYKAWSVDLSDATSSFPFTIQVEALRRCEFIPKDQVDLLERACTGLWRVGNKKIREFEPGLRFLRWTKGQPLGLYPSFPLFALAHHAIVLKCWFIRKDRLAQGKSFADHDPESLERARSLNAGDAYRMCGDDIVFFDEDLATIYCFYMEHLNVKVSLDKTLADARVAEFCGRVITPEHIYTLPKWKSSNDNSFVDILRQFGPKALGLLRSRQKKVMKWLAPLPESLGGLGWNPKGLPLKDRLLAAEKFIYRDNVRVVGIENPYSRVIRWLNDACYGKYRKSEKKSGTSRNGIKEKGVPLIEREEISNPFIALNPKTTGPWGIPEEPSPIIASAAPVSVRQTSVPQTTRERILRTTGVSRDTEKVLVRENGLPSLEDTTANLKFHGKPLIKWATESEKGRKTTLEVLESYDPMSPNS